MINVQIYRYNPDRDKAPYMQALALPDDFRKRMVLDALEYLRENDPTLSYRRSCAEGVCGSDGMNINGKNWLAVLSWRASCCCSRSPFPSSRNKIRRRMMAHA